MYCSVLNFVIMFAFLQIVYCQNDNEKTMLSQMQDWGAKIVKFIDSKLKRPQYLVAVLLPDAALDKPKELSKRLLKGCPTKPTKPDIGGKMIECSTSAVILNKISKDIWQNSPWKNQNYENHPWHGEYRLLNEGIIERLIANFRKENGNDAKCRVYLYSYFIPCADIRNCPYSCSDQVAEYNNRAGTTCKVTVIGYTAVFRRSKTMKTNERRAKDVLKAVTDLYHIVSDVKLHAIRTVRNMNDQVPFQELMYTCLYESPLSGCCVDDTDARGNSELVIAYFVNNIVSRATNDPKFKNKRFSDRSRKAFNKYFSELFERQVGSGCSKCRFGRYITFLISFCSKTALDLASGFGSPTSPFNLSSATWDKPSGNWKNLYRITPKKFLDTYTVLCADRSLSIDSLCTRLSVENINQPVSQKRQLSEGLSMPLSKSARDGDKNGAGGLHSPRWA